MGNNPARKMMRTKREQAILLENMNRDAIQKIMQQQIDLAQKFSSFVNEIVSKYNTFVAETIKFQKEVLAIRNALKTRGIINEFDIAQEMGFIEEREEMERKAIIIGVDKREKKDEKGGELDEKNGQGM